VISLFESMMGGLLGQSCVWFFLKKSLAHLPFYSTFWNRSYTQGRTGNGRTEPSKDTLHVFLMVFQVYPSPLGLCLFQNTYIWIYCVIARWTEPKKCYWYWFKCKRKRNLIYSLIKKVMCSPLCSTNNSILQNKCEPCLNISELLGKKGSVTMVHTFLHKISSDFPF
jgi:hypothetical protein